VHNWAGSCQGEKNFFENSNNPLDKKHRRTLRFAKDTKEEKEEKCGRNS
jgi:hypothetical protein